ncbi:hypothetical protein FRACYDRAFT_235400 [Fragilariopsis cylindrus CCMP1102]|uniref:Aminoglycoside phosphotransferase domain-containing protein n=1 Tax=Fragilariopsis cylindrus CCMP1102 TaxID=635003 RepID=A0A1E7FNI4_9STRA|nr:hypothetical protein FRACYDRAFT_235400 [Fragilariopsis cylindrus CCMP1102]|eukprot:OEU19353.1 hypothetical protein FRACYDRAFT_235400 [Fragilariopsis cylindrus CCMP1102]
MTTTTTLLLRKRKQHFNATIVLSLCPPLPDRLMNSYHNYGKHIIPPPSLEALLLSTEDVDRQKLIMRKMKHGTMGDSILKCPSLSLSLPLSLSSCRGILKVYQSNTVYQHVKFCLTLLQDTGIVPRILYSNDTTQTIVEEEKGQYTMRSYYSTKSTSTIFKIPIDFDQQLRRILCILQQHSLIHRDITDANFMIDDETGMISIIDFGDAAYVAAYDEPSANANYYNWRNRQNLWMIWWNNYLETQRMEEFIAIIQSQLRNGLRKQWRPPSSSSLRQQQR